VTEPVRLIVCVGGDCRRAKGFAPLLELAARTDGATTVPCQGVCHAPMVAVDRDGDVRWYRRIRGDRRRVLARLVRTGKGRKRLREVEVRRRRGVVRHARRRRPLRVG
jgi:hypothetical protein